MPYIEKILPPVFFRAYDIRGIVDEQFDANGFYTIGRAMALRLRQLDRRQIYLARDGRLTSASLAKALCQGLLDSGIDVIDLGETTSPMMYYATHHAVVDSGVIVTASHNPAHYNGVKIIFAGKTLVQEDINILYELVKAQNFSKGEGCYFQENITQAYVQRITADICLQRRFKVVVDCGNGSAGPIIPGIFSRLGCTVIPLFCEVNGHFPHHHPDPTMEVNLMDLKKTVLQQQADIGFAFDGDADRLGIVTNNGETIWADRLLMFYARDLLSRLSDATIVFDVKCSKDLPELIHRLGGQAAMCPTGHSIVKKVMEEKKAVLAGEMSGHIFFRDRWYGFDDAVYSACRLLEILSADERTVSEQFAFIPQSIATPEIKIPIREDKKFSYIDQFIEKARFPEAKLITIDGIRAEFNQGWGLLRASNTSACLIARFEAKNQQTLSAIQALFKAQILQVDASLHVPF